ncbi:MAG: hypothetical protein QM737_22105 [Ferruginibacter sp.]
MKKHFFYIIITLFLAGSCEQKTIPEPNIFCGLTRTEPGNNGSAITVGTPYSFFGTAFWSYLCNKYPAAIEIIFPAEPIETWGVSKLVSTNEKFVDTSKYYFSRILALSLRKKIDDMLTKDPNQSASVRKDFLRFKRLLSNTEYDEMTLFCDKGTLKLIQDHKYAQ